MAALDAEGVGKVIRAHKKRPLSSDLLRECFDRAQNPDGGWSGTQGREIREFIASYPLSPSDLLERMLDECASESATLALLAAHPRTSPGNLARLLESPQPEVRAAAAQNPQISPRQLGELAADASETVALAAAAHGQLKSRHMAALAMSRHPGVRAALARHPKLDAQIALALTADPSPMVRFTLAAAGQLDAGLMQAIADSDNLELQLGLLERKELPDTALHSLLLSTHGEVRRKVAAECELDLPYLVLLVEQGDAADHAFLAARTDLPAPLFETLASIGSPDTLHRLAQNPALPEPLAERFLQLDESLHLTLLDNPTHRARAIDALLGAEDESSQALLAYLDDVPANLLGELVNERLAAGLMAHLAVAEKPIPKLRADLAYALSQHPVPALRRLALRGFPFPAGTLARLAADPCAEVASTAKAQLAKQRGRTDPDDGGSVFSEGPGLDAWRQRIDAYLQPEPDTVAF